MLKFLLDFSSNFILLSLIKFNGIIPSHTPEYIFWCIRFVYMYFLLCPFGCDAKGQRRRYQRRKRKTRDKNDNHYALTGIYLCSASPNLAAQLSQERLICILYVANMQLCCNSERENEQALACNINSIFSRRLMWLSVQSGVSLLYLVLLFFSLPPK